MLAEIVSYLRMLRARDRQDLLAAIENFTRTFPNFAQFTIDGYIRRVEAVVTGNFATDQAAAYSIAMPPEAVVDYLRNCCELPGAHTVPLTAQPREYILGVRHAANPGGMYDGLKHYFYSLGGTLYSWGQRFDALDPSYQECCKIAIQ